MNRCDSCKKEMLGIILMEIREKCIKLPVKRYLNDVSFSFDFDYMYLDDLFEIKRTIDINTFSPIACYCLKNNRYIDLHLDCLLDWKLVDSSTAKIMLRRTEDALVPVKDTTPSYETAKILNDFIGNTNK